MAKLIIKVDGKEVDGGFYCTRTEAILAAILADLKDYRVEQV